MKTQDANFDGLVGLTHNYSGLSQADQQDGPNKDRVAHPRQAALESLNKMRGLMNLGLRQGVLPPHERPAIGFLRDLGFSGSDHRIWEKAWTQAPRYARAAAASASMWASNSATVSPSADCGNGLLHISVANLNAALHRSIEAEASERVLRRIFADERRFGCTGRCRRRRAFAMKAALIISVLALGKARKASRFRCMAAASAPPFFGNLPSFSAPPWTGARAGDFREPERCGAEGRRDLQRPRGGGA